MAHSIHILGLHPRHQAWSRVGARHHLKAAGFSPSFWEGLQSQTVGVALEHVIDSVYARVNAGEQAGAVHGGEGQLNMVYTIVLGMEARVYACKEAGDSSVEQSAGFAPGSIR